MLIVCRLCAKIYYMKKILIIIFFSIIYVTSAQSFNSFAKYKGQGELKITKGYIFDTLELYFTAGKYGNIKDNPKYDWQKKILRESWTGSFIILSQNGKALYWQYNTWDNKADNSPNYLGKAVIKCREQGHGECFVFAIKNKIVWQNGINPKKGTRIKKKDARKGILTAKLKELGFMEKKTKKNKVKKKSKKITKKKIENNNFVDQLNKLNDLYKSGVLTKEEFDKAKKKLLN